MQHICLHVHYLLNKMGWGWGLINRFNPGHPQDLDFQCHLSCGHFFVHWLGVRDDCLFCWYWWNCWPSLFNLSFHKRERKRSSSQSTLILCTKSYARKLAQEKIKSHITPWKKSKGTSEKIRSHATPWMKSKGTSEKIRSHATHWKKIKEHQKRSDLMQHLEWKVKEHQKISDLMQHLEHKV